MLKHYPRSRLANKREYAKMHFDAFPAQQFVMFIPYSNKDALTYGLLEQTITARPVGLRVDCLGQNGYFDQWSNRPAEWAAFADQWKTAPFVAEFCPFESGQTGTSAAIARQQTASWHISAVGNGNFALSKPDSERWASLTAAEQNDLLMLGREAGYRYAVDKTSVTLTSSQPADGGRHHRQPRQRAYLRAVERECGTGRVRRRDGLVGAAAAAAGRLVRQPARRRRSRAAGACRCSLLLSSYTLRLAARDLRAQPRAPLRWTIDERAADGTLVVGTLRRR
ncbi:hypothetical protein LP420_03910 [Massilia sp. B-10]|nr:hypothetical protein LP420_03910 [Massilia sp. B-10]